MNAFDKQHARMLDLINYKQVVNESENTRSSIEDSKIAANGKSYAIIRECSKYYIKTADADKHNIAEAYDYIGGITEKSKHEYTSCANARKDFNIIMMALNEDHGTKTAEPVKEWDYVVEGTDSMKRELARQRQLMENVCKIGRDCQCDPERVSGSNDPDKPYTDAGKASLDKDMPKANCKPASESDPYGDGKAPEKGKDVKDSDVLSQGKAVATEHPSGGKVVRVNEANAAAGSDTDINGAKDWNKGFCGNGDPKSNGWEMEGQQNVNEDDEKEWDKGLPGSAGIGEADTDHNNDPFNKTINEEEFTPDFQDPGVPAEVNNPLEEGEDDEEEVPEIIDGEGEDGAEIEDEPIDDAEIEGEPADDAEIEAEPADDAEGDDEFDFGGDDIDDRISELESEIASIKAELGLDSEEEAIEDEPIDDTEIEAEPADDAEIEDEPIDEPISDDELDAEGEPVGDEGVDDEMGDEFYGDEDECIMNEAKKAVMDRIVEAVVKKVISEEATVLHDFGKHPGYRKKPMTLPQTGTDKDINGARDWNDDSVHNEKPFGSSIGDGKPYDQAVKIITDNIMAGLKKKM